MFAGGAARIRQATAAVSRVQRSQLHTGPSKDSEWNVPYEVQNWRSWEEVQRERQEEKGLFDKDSNKSRWNIPHKKQNWNILDPREHEDAEKEEEEREEDREEREEDEEEEQEDEEYEGEEETEDPKPEPRFRFNKGVLRELISKMSDGFDALDKIEAEDALNERMEVT